jgi:hypothetical protein
MNTNNDASGKTIWAGKIKQNMVSAQIGSGQATYVLDLKKNSAVEIHFAAPFLSPLRQLPRVAPAVARSSDTLDVSSADFLILNRNPALNSHRQHIPWNKIVEILFLDA